VIPKDVIVPIFGWDFPGETLPHFLGTGSIIGDGSILLTADHVTKDAPGRVGFFHLDNLSKPYQVELIERDQPHDLALFRTNEYRPEHPLELAFEEPVHTNNTLMTFEYGTTRTEGARIDLNPATRLGHMTRMIDLTETHGPAGLGAFELSFPALRGASGAPVMFDETGTRVLMGQKGFQIVGVIVSNASYHLLPAQIESVIDIENNYAEEIRYMLPQAVAVNINHLRPMYERALHAS
jgi:hypothetical protein